MKEARSGGAHVWHQDYGSVLGGVGRGTRIWVSTRWGREGNQDLGQYWVGSGGEPGFGSVLGGVGRGTRTTGQYWVGSGGEPGPRVSAGWGRIGRGIRTTGQCWPQPT